MKFLRWLLGISFGTAGVLHFTRERQFRNIVPDYLPLQKTAVLVTGVFEIFFGIALLIKRPASWLKKGINLFLLAVLPANVYMARKKHHLVIKKCQHGHYGYVYHYNLYLLVL